MPKQFPKVEFPEALYVKIEDDGEGGTFPIAAAAPGDLLDSVGEAVMAAEYKLVRAGVIIDTEVVVR